MAKAGVIDTNFAQEPKRNVVREERSKSSPIAPSSTILVIGATDADAGDIESLCLPNNILVTPLPLAQSAENENGGDVDAVVLNFEVLNQDSANAVNRWRYFGLPVLCILPPEEAINTELLSRLRVEDFLFRPYRPEEFMCRLRVLLAKRKRAVNTRMIEKRRSNRRQSDRNDHTSKLKLLTRNSLIIDPKAKRVILNGAEIKLTRREYTLLAFLGAEPGRVRSSEEIIEQAWGGAKRASSSDVQQYIHLLRKKIESDHQDPRWIITVKGFGYKLEVPS